MNALEKEKFVARYMAMVESEIIENIRKMPDDWDGIELRQYISDKFSYYIMNMEKSRKKSYNNTVLIGNL